MRICHFADNHLGAGDGQREQDILDAFERAIGRIIELKPDLAINAGDLFHMVRPSNRVIAFASEQLLRLGRDAQIPLVIICGNHDAPKQPKIGAALEIFKDYENIHAIYSSRYERVRIGDCSVSAVPHCLTTDILKEELDKIQPDPGAGFNILVLHGVVAGIKEFEMAQLSEQTIEAKYFELGFDYVALGHYHNFRQVAENTYYSGSTERLSQSEAAHAKGLIELTLDNEGKRTVVFHEIATRPMVDLPVLNAAAMDASEVIAEIEKQIKNQGPADKIIRLKVRDISEETYRALSFTRIDELKSGAFALDIRFEKAEKKEENPLSDINLGRLDRAFEKFLDSRTDEKLDREKLKKLGLDFLHRAESVDE